MSNPSTKYCVRDMVTGLFQNAGVDKTYLHPEVRWSNKGKKWKSLDELKEHFSHLKEHNISVSPLWEVVEVTARTGAEQTSYPAVAVFS